MTYTAVIKGKERTLPAPASVVYDCSEDAPADSFTGVFPMDEMPGAISGVRIYGAGGGLVFDGIVDIQKDISAGKTYALLSARSRAGLLLDSEPPPQSYTYPSLPVIYERHVKPYGFTGFTGSRQQYKGTVTVTKGMSEWQGVAAYCRHFLRVTPRVRGGVLDASGELPQTEVVFCNRTGVRYSSAERKNRYCDRYSETYAPPQPGGAYVLAQADSETEALGIIRKRCIASGGGAYAAMKETDRKSCLFTVDCPGGIPAQLYSQASLKDPFLGDTAGLYVSGFNYTADGRGEHCKVMLRKRQSG